MPKFPAWKSQIDLGSYLDGRGKNKSFQRRVKFSVFEGIVFASRPGRVHVLEKSLFKSGQGDNRTNSLSFFFFHFVSNWQRCQLQK